MKRIYLAAVVFMISGCGEKAIVIKSDGHPISCYGTNNDDFFGSAENYWMKCLQRGCPDNKVEIVRTWPTPMFRCLPQQESEKKQ